MSLKHQLSVTENQGQPDTEVIKRGKGGVGRTSFHHSHSGGGSDCCCTEVRGERTSAAK